MESKEPAVTVKKLAHLKGHGSPVYSLSKTHDNTIYSAGGDQLVTQWNLDELVPGKLSARLPSPVYSVCHIAESNLLLAGSSSGAVHIIDLNEKKEVKMLQHHSAGVFDIKCSAKHDRIYMAGGDGALSVCSLSSLSLIAIKKLCTEKVRGLALDAEENTLAVASGDGMIRVFDAATLNETASFKAHDLSANTVAFHPSGKHLLSGGRDAHLNIWSIKDNYNLVQSIPAHNFAIYSIAFSPSRNLFATASRDKTIKLWNADTFEFLLRVNKEKHESHSHSVNSLVWSSYRDLLISAGDDRAVMVWEVASADLGESAITGTCG